jgi:hypothetical protein
MEALVDQRMKEMEARNPENRCCKCSWLMTIFFEKTYGDLWRRGYFKIQIHFQRNNLGTGGGDMLTNGFITKPAESTVNEMKKV